MAVSWRLQGNLKRITADIKAVCPKATVYSVGDASHQSRASDHNPYNWGYGTVVSAIDVMIRNGFTKTDAANLVKALRGRSDIQYIIYNGVIWSASWGWGAKLYLGRDRHTDHVHVSGKHTKAADTTAKKVTFRRPKPVTSPVVHKPVTTKPVNGQKPAPKPAVREKAPTFPLGPSGSYREERSNLHFSKGVQAFQKELKQRGWKIEADGLFGQDTRKIVEAFQKEKKLKVDGFVGPVTWKAIWESKVK